jgi:hypothetical protein
VVYQPHVDIEKHKEYEARHATQKTRPAMKPEVKIEKN